MPRMRRDIWKPAADWTDTTLWYARAVASMSGSGSWSRLAKQYAVGVRKFRSAAASTKTPRRGRSPFLAWHRLALARFEATVSRVVAELGGPPDWALPYWSHGDRANPDARRLPPAFVFERLPDGSTNPLRIDRRHGAGGGLVVLTPNDVSLDALLESEFAGRDDGGAPGFGGCASGRFQGLLEQVPHDVVHARVGGRDGLMSSPETAPVDPVFWVHHANVDRLWQIWLNRNAGWREDPGLRRKLVGDPNEMPPDALLDIPSHSLNYTYEDLADPFEGVTRLTARASLLHPANRSTWQAAPSLRGVTKPAKLMTAHELETVLEGGIARVSIHAGKRKLAALAASYERPDREPDRAFVAFEGICGSNDAAIFEVYLDLPPNAVPGDRPDRLLGVVSLFGVRAMSLRGRHREGEGLNKVLEATPVLDRLYLAGALPLGEMTIDIVPTSDIRREDRTRIRRIALWRQPSR